MKNPAAVHENCLVKCLVETTEDCVSVLDFGCSLGKYLSDLENPVRVGIDAHMPYLAKAYPGPVYMLGKLPDFSKEHLIKASFDVVLMVDVVEHLDLSDACILLEEAKRVARKRVVLFIPIGKHPQDSPVKWQVHRSTWTVEMVQSFGFDCVLWEKFHSAKGKDSRACFAIWEPA